MSTLRVTTIEAKADGSSPSVNEKVKITNSSGDVMLQLDGATSGITTVGINTTDPAFTVDANRNFEFVGVVTASSFTGNLTGNVTGGITTSQITVGNSFINSTSIGIGTTTTAGRNAGVGTAAGTIIFNTTTKQLEVYSGNNWTVGSTESFSATGGTIDTTSRSGFRVHTFTEPGDFTVASGEADVEYLVIAGGGGGGVNAGSGGGAGGYRISSSFPVSPGPHPVQVGGGGAGGSIPAPSPAVSGTPSFFGTITSIGGGNGEDQNEQNAGNGGSGGGSAAGHTIGSGINPSTPQPVLTPFGLTAPYLETTGNPGGGSSTGDGVPRTGGGGGGAGGTGGSNANVNVGGAGGPGQPSSITGSPVLRAGGGGGAAHNNPGIGAPGPGGGGRGGPGGGGVGQDGTTNTGGGGGAGGGNYGTGNGGAGGSGIVIIAYPDNS